MRLVTVTSIVALALVVLMALGCGNESDDPFLTEMADWFGDNPRFLMYASDRQENALRALDDIFPQPFPGAKYYNEYRILRDTLELLSYSLEHTEIFQAEEYQRAESLGYDLDEMIECGYFTESFDVNLQFYRTCYTNARLYSLYQMIDRHWLEDIFDASRLGKDPYGVRERK
jgi:hypothetical protein